MGFAYHYFTIRPGLFEARVSFFILKEKSPSGRILSEKRTAAPAGLLPGLSEKMAERGKLLACLFFIDTIRAQS